MLRAKLMGADDADELERQYEAASRGVGGSDGNTRTKVEVLPTLDGHGRLYDVGHGGKEDDEVRPGNRKKKEEKVYLQPPLRDLPG